MAEGEASLEPTIEISAGDYPEIMRIFGSGGDIDQYLERTGVPPEVLADAFDADATTTGCAREKAALGGSLRFAVDAAGEVDGSTDELESVIVPVPSAASLMTSLRTVGNDGLVLAECLEGPHAEAAASVREAFELLALDIDRLRRAIEAGAGTA